MLALKLVAGVLAFGVMAWALWQDARNREAEDRGRVSPGYMRQKGWGGR